MLLYFIFYILYMTLQLSLFLELYCCTSKKNAFFAYFKQIESFSRQSQEVGHWLARTPMRVVFLEIGQSKEPAGFRNFMGVASKQLLTCHYDYRQAKQYLINTKPSSQLSHYPYMLNSLRKKHRYVQVGL